MRVGIYTQYSHCDQAYLSIRLVNFLRSRGVDFDIYSDRQPGKLGLQYDAAVCHRDVRKYTEWLQRQTTVVWTHVPKVEQLSLAEKNGKQTIVVPLWQELMPPFKRAIRRADVVVALSKEEHELYSSIYNFRRTILIPFDAGLPIVKKEASTDPRAVKVFLPWFDRNARCANSEFLAGLGYLFERMPDGYLTIAITSSQFSPSIAKYFQTLGKKTDGRVRLIRNVPYSGRASLYTEHDLTLFPAECDNYGHCLLSSINCGTPVVTLATAPQTDFVYQEANGVLVKTKIDYDEFGVPHAATNYEKLFSTLQSLIAEPWHIDRINQKITYNLVSRRSHFEQGWESILQLN